MALRLQRLRTASRMGHYPEADDAQKFLLWRTRCSHWRRSERGAAGWPTRLPALRETGEQIELPIRTSCWCLLQAGRCPVAACLRTLALPCPITGGFDGGSLTKRNAMSNPQACGAGCAVALG